MPQPRQNRSCGECASFIDPVRGAIAGSGELIFGCSRRYTLLEDPVCFDIFRSERLSADRACDEFSAPAAAT